MEKKYYEEYYFVERNHWWFRGRLHILESWIRKLGTKKLRILNIGPATGKTSQMLEQYGEVVSLEYDEECYKFLRDRLKLKVVLGSIENIPFEDSSFDLVCAFDVIEHVPDDFLAVAEMKRVCKKNGVIFITVPALMILWGEHDLINHHFRRYKLDQVKNLFGSFSGRIRFAAYFSFFLFPPIFLARTVSKFVRKRITKKIKLKSDFERYKVSKFDFLLCWIFRLESLFLINKMKFPIGSSLMLIYENDN